MNRGFADHKFKKKNGVLVEEVVDSGVEDKRLFECEKEFASVLTVIQREGNTLSPIIRSAWDNENLRPLVKNSRYGATGAHIGIDSIFFLSDDIKHLGNKKNYDTKSQLDNNNE
ncbi:MAG: hypothetical protein R6U27_12955 [Desulfobacterales bacterium]